MGDKLYLCLIKKLVTVYSIYIKKYLSEFAFNPWINTTLFKSALHL